MVRSNVDYSTTTFFNHSNYPFVLLVPTEEKTIAFCLERTPLEEMQKISFKSLVTKP